MFSNTRTTRIEWGDCDPAGIIFYPRYFEIFDVSTTMLLERAIGMKKIEYLKAFDFLGHPVV
jgi:4-hydroxybenzoyl-CoA thioesterase